MKASYILYDIVLKDENSRANLTDENRKLIADLSEVRLGSSVMPALLTEERESKKSFRSSPR